MSEEYANEWLELGAMLNKALGHPVCYARCEHGGACGLETGHEGFHDSDGGCQWEDSTLIPDRVLP